MAAIGLDERFFPWGCGFSDLAARCWRGSGGEKKREKWEVEGRRGRGVKGGRIWHIDIYRYLMHTLTHSSYSWHLNPPFVCGPGCSP